MMSEACELCNGTNIVTVGFQLRHDGNLPVLWCDRCGKLTFSPEYWTGKVEPTKVPLLMQGKGMLGTGAAG